MCRVVSCLLALLLVCVSVPTAFGEADNGPYVPLEYLQQINQKPVAQAIEQVGSVLAMLRKADQATKDEGERNSGGDDPAVVVGGGEFEVDPLEMDKMKTTPLGW